MTASELVVWLAVWLLLSGPLVLLIGALICRRDRQLPRHARPRMSPATPATSPSSGGVVTGSLDSAPAAVRAAAVRRAA